MSGVHYATYVGIAISFVCGLTLAFTFYFFSHFFLSLDINVHDPAMANLVQTAKQFLAVLAVFYLVESIRLIISYGVLRGLKDVRFNMFAAIFSFWVMGLAFAFLFGFVYPFQGIGLWSGLTLGAAFGAVVAIIRWRSLVKRIDLSKLISVTGE
jgi:MATE family multidrug resistance protein